MRLEIHQGDFTSVGRYLPQQPEFILIDPPYNQGKNYAGEVDDKLSEAEYASLILKACALVNAQGQRAAIVLPRKLIPEWGVALSTEGLPWTVIAVHKRAKGVKVTNLFNQWVPILVTCPPLLSCDDFWEDIRLPGEGYYFRERRYGHPGITSLALTKRVIAHWTRPGDLVVDFFAGVETTGVACRDLGRDFVGVEKSEEYVRITRERFDEATQAW